MRFNSELSDEALLDLDEVRSFYSEISSELLERFDKDITKTVERIEENPQHFQKRYRDIKIVFTKKFPFGIHYLVDGNIIFFQRILHRKRFYE